MDRPPGVSDSTTFSLVPGLPSTTSAAGVSTDSVRQLRRYYARVRLLADVHARIVLLAFRPDPLLFRWMPARPLGSRARRFWTCVWLLDYAGPDENSCLRSHQCDLPVGSTRSAPGIRFSKLDSLPVDAPVYTSPGTSRPPAQDLRSRWFATPFSWGAFIPDCTPVYPDACAPSRSRLGDDCKRAPVTEPRPPASGFTPELRNPRSGKRPSCERNVAVPQQGALP
jgi:hypothetical protein